LIIYEGELTLYTFILETFTGATYLLVGVSSTFLAFTWEGRIQLMSIASTHKIYNRDKKAAGITKGKGIGFGLADDTLSQCLKPNGYAKM